MSLNCDEAAKAVRAGKIIAYPTEAIYGLGCDPLNLQALQGIVDLKIRASKKGLILVASDWQQLEPFVHISEQSILDVAMQSWPGPVTWIMPASELCPALLTGNRDSIAVRISAHPVVRELCECCAHALVSTSANISGTQPLDNADAIRDAFGDNIAGVVAGELGELQSATSIFDARTGAQLR